MPRMTSLSQAIGLGLATRMRHGPALARSMYCPSPIRSDNVTVKCCRRKNSAIFCCTSVSLATLRSGRTTSFSPSVSGSARMRNHLSAVEHFTPRTYHGEADDKAEEDRPQDHLAILVMDELITRLALAGQRNPRDVDCDHRGAGEKQPQEIDRAPAVIDPLRNNDPAQECVSHISERGARRRYQHIARIIGEANQISGALGPQQPRRHRCVEFEQGFREELEQQAAP